MELTQKVSIDYPYEQEKAKPQKLRIVDLIVPIEADKNIIDKPAINHKALEAQDDAGNWHPVGVYTSLVLAALAAESYLNHEVGTITIYNEEPTEKSEQAEAAESV